VEPFDFTGTSSNAGLVRNTMKFSSILTLVLSVSVFGLTACGKKETVAAPATVAKETAKPNPSTVKEMEKPVAEKAPAGKTVTVTANDTMKFDVTSIEAAAGTELTITLVNTGALPKAAMGHNLVLLKKSANSGAFASAAMTAPQTEYIPAQMKDQVLAATKLLGPGESDSFTITVPSEPGEYVYLCSFPAHFMAGMKGVLVVK
jgi:azurin